MRKKAAPQPHLPEFGGERGGNELLLNDGDDDDVSEEAPVAGFDKHDNAMDNGTWGPFEGTF